MRNIFVLAVLFLGLISCDSNQTFDTYYPVENNIWLKGDVVEFQVEVEDTISKNNIFINIRNNKDYEFSNLFLIASMEFPNGLKVIDTLEYEMTDKVGDFLGSGYTDIKENKLFYKENVRFQNKGLHILKVEQAMRKSSNIHGLDSLKGISDIGLRIETVIE
ncbi:MAG: gliding motility lipoprotein GldH [Flavobacteriaceae bacterium]|nr:MAG: gliding motility lipoprotein GldH [Flavobacteriaceae bacterium]